jgi:hypothetical protein
MKMAKMGMSGKEMRPMFAKKKGAVKTTGTYKGKSNKLGGGGRFAQIADKAGGGKKGAAIAAAIGRRKYGAKKMAAMSAAGRKRKA